ncbi:MAG: glycosyltransferase family 2 protein [Deltaproteobacteria bacterium]|nr:glycosyltransferase family 2 protein [Deltaproteobacteria bacterium]
MTDGLSVIIPVLNEADILEANTRHLLEYLKTLSRPFEIIIVSNGSTDQTETIGRNLPITFKEVTFLALTIKGVGRAFAAGVHRARFSHMVSLDMDLSIDLDFIPRSLDLLREFQMVVGSKKMGSQRRTFVRKAGSTAFILTARALLGLSFKDYSIAAKAYRREMVLKHLDRIDEGTSYVLELIYHVQANGGRAVEIPVYCQDFRVSKFNLLHEAVYRFHHLFRLWWRYRVTGDRRESYH